MFCRTEAASSVLKRSAVKERSYVLSAARKYEYACFIMVIRRLHLLFKMRSICNEVYMRVVCVWTNLRAIDASADTPLVSGGPAFVAKR